MAAPTEYIMFLKIFQKSKEQKLVPQNLTPNRKEVVVKREIKSTFGNDILWYEDDNGFTYVDNDAVERNFQAVMAMWYPH